jgi:hypothetical protein
MIFWPFCAFIWFKNIEKMLLQMTSGFLQLESTLGNVASNKFWSSMSFQNLVRLSQIKKFSLPDVRDYMWIDRKPKSTL